MRGEAIAISMLLLAGCVADPPPDETTPIVIPDDPGATPAVLVSTMLPVGLAWTYEGQEIYNEDATFTVIVASASERGYLFAAGAEDDLVYEATWESPWYGYRDARLARTNGYLRVLDLPLADGKSWDFIEGRKVTARAADVATPRGIEPGFVIEGERIRYEYAPTIGNIVLWEATYSDGTLGERVRMTKVEEGRTGWVWYDRGDLVAVTADDPAAFELAAGYDALLVSAGGMQGSRAFVQPPNGAAPWSTEFGADEDWRQAMLDPTEGRWEAAVVGHPSLAAPIESPDAPIGWGYMHLAPVKWIRST